MTGTFGLETQSEEVACKAYEELRVKAPGMFTSPWPDLHEKWRMAMTLAAIAGADAACESILSQEATRKASEKGVVA